MTNLSLNKVHPISLEEGCARIPDRSISLIIADKPYYRVKGQFDFIWKDRSAYLYDLEGWARSLSRVLAPNGSLFLYGHALNIAYDQVVFDRFFSLKNAVVWEKLDCVTRRGAPSAARRFTPVTERMLFYGSDIEVDEKRDCLVFQPLMDYFKQEREAMGWNYSTLDTFLRVKSKSCYWDKPTTQKYRIPNIVDYKRLQSTGKWQRSYQSVRAEFDALNLVYLSNRRPFQNESITTDIIRTRQGISSFGHPTAKSVEMTRQLIRLCSRPGDLLLIPFAGEGNECEAAKLEGRDFIAFDHDPHWAAVSNRRLAAVSP